jgi:hypothetical protein
MVAVRPTPKLKQQMRQPTLAHDAEARVKAEIEAKALRRLRDDYARRYPDSNSNPFGEPELKPITLVASTSIEADISHELGSREGKPGDGNVSLALGEIKCKRD